MLRILLIGLTLAHERPEPRHAMPDESAETQRPERAPSSYG